MEWDRKRAAVNAGKQDKRPRLAHRHRHSGKGVGKHTSELMGRVTEVGETKGKRRSVQRFRQSHGGSSPPLPTRSQPAAASETGNTSGHQHQQHPGEQPVTVTAYREGQTSAKQTGKPERKSDDPKSPAGTSSECGTDRGSENKRHAQGKKKNDKLTVHAHLSGRSRTFEGKRKGSLLPGISRSYLGAPRRAPPHLYQGSLSFYGESPLLAKLRGGAVCRF